MNLTDPEWRLMNVLWDENPLSAGQVLERQDQDSWAYTTVKTMLSRLVDKGVVSESKQGNTSFYSPLLERTDARQAAVHKLAEKAFGGALGPLMKFMAKSEKLSDKDRESIQRMLDEASSEGAL